MDHADDRFFQVSVKGLCFDKEHKLLMIQEKNGMWELPGGRMQKGEDFISCLQRECLEEMGLGCKVLDSEPFFVYPAIDKKGRGRIMVFYRINFDFLDIKYSDECVDFRFYDKDQIARLNIYPQLARMAEFF